MFSYVSHKFPLRMEGNSAGAFVSLKKYDYIVHFRCRCHHVQ